MRTPSTGTLLKRQISSLCRAQTIGGLGPMSKTQLSQHDFEREIKKTLEEFVSWMKEQQKIN